MANCKNNSPAKCSTVGRGFNYLDIMLHNVVISTSSRGDTGLSADSLLSALRSKLICLDLYADRILICWVSKAMCGRVGNVPVDGRKEIPKSKKKFKHVKDQRINEDFFIHLMVKKMKIFNH